MPEYQYVLTFAPRAEFSAEDRRILKDSLGTAVRLVTEDSSPVAIDQHDDQD